MPKAGTVAAETGTLSRRHLLLLLGTALALPVGCVRRLSVGEVDLGALDPDHVLLLGRVRVTIVDEDRSGDSFIRTDASDDEALLGPEGEVAWVVRSAPGRDIRLRAVSFSDGWLSGGLCLLAPGVVRTPIVYFGTIHLEMLRAAGSNPERPRVNQLAKQIVDDHGPDMAAFVARNPRLARRQYYNVLRGAVSVAPEAPAVAGPSAIPA